MRRYARLFLVIGLAWIVAVQLAKAGESTMPGERAALKSTCANSPPFFCVGGKPGGQTLTCGTQSGDGCTFSSTSHATKGKHLFGSGGVYTLVVDEANKRLGNSIPVTANEDFASEGAAYIAQRTTYGAFTPKLLLRQAEGTVASPTATASGRTIGQFSACGYDGTVFCGFLGIPDVGLVMADDGGTFTTSSHPTQICLSTTPSGSTVAANNLCIRKDGTAEFTKTAAKYNNIATVSNGVPAEYATTDTTGLTANVGSTLLYAVPSTGAGLYRISALVVETTAASVSSTLANVQIVYTDKDVGSGTVTIDATPVLGVAGVGQTGALTANTVGTTATGVIVIDAKASTNINYQTVNYASSTAGMTYAVHIKLEAL